MTAAGRMEGQSSMTRRRVQKVFAYITYGSANRRLLVFRQPASPEAGIQVPAGTLQQGEVPEKAVLREAEEETGLTDLALRGFLGTTEYDMAQFGRDEIHVRHFFHLECKQETPSSWKHGETGGGVHAAIEFELFWVPLPNGVPELIAAHGALLDRLLEPNIAAEP
jgi:8-oxo-dGTP diphosphatase